jgi:hypothetical protein
MDTDWLPLAHNFLLLQDALGCDLDEVRKGSMVLMNNRGTGWENFRVDFEEKWALLDTECYPKKPTHHVMVDNPQAIDSIFKVYDKLTGAKAVDLSRCFSCCRAEELGAEPFGFSRTALPGLFGGVRDEPFGEWMEERMARRERSLKAVTFPK